MSIFDSNNIATANDIVEKFCTPVEAAFVPVTFDNKGSGRKKSKSKVANKQPQQNITQVQKKPNKFSSFELPDVIEKGERENVLFRYASSLRAKNLDENAIRILVDNANQNNCVEPLDDDEIETCELGSVFKYALGAKPAKEIGSTVAILKDRNYVFLTNDDVVEDALKKMNLTYFKLSKGANVTISKNKDSIRYVLAGFPDFNREMKDKLEDLDASYSQVVSLGFTRSNLSNEKKLWEMYFKLLEIDECDENAFVFQNSVLYERDNEYHIFNDKGVDKTISNFRIEIIDEVDNLNDGGLLTSTEYTMKFHLNNGMTLVKRVQSSNFSSASQYKKWIKSDTIQLSYMGNDNELELIQQRIIRDSKGITKRTGIDHTGIYSYKGKHGFVGVDKSFYDDESLCVEIVSSFEPTGCILSELEDMEKIGKDEMENLLKVIFDFNCRSVTVPIVSWCVAAFFKERFREINWKMPHLMVIGEAGSGKSSISESIITPLFSIKSSALACDKLTQFSSTKAICSSNVVPTILEEFKPSRLGARVNQISALLRSAYDCQEVRKGTASLKVIEFLYRSPIVVVGEASTEEKAIKDRSIEVTCSLFNRTQEHTDNYFKLVDYEELLKKLGKSILVEALSIENDKMRDMLQENLRYFQQTTTFSSRNQAGLAILLFGMRILKKMCEDMGLDFSNLTGIAGSEIAQSVVESMTSGLGDGSGTSSKSEVEKTIEIFSTLAKGKLIEEGVHYSINRANNEVTFYLKELYPVYTKYHRDYNLTSDVDLLSKNTFSKQLRNSIYFKALDNRVYVRKDYLGNVISNASLKVFILHRDKLVSNLDVDNF